jgi:hypothetical protein
LRLSQEATPVLKELARRHGISQTAVLEMAIRHQARRDLIPLERDAASDKEEAGDSA